MYTLPVLPFDLDGATKQAGNPVAVALGTILADERPRLAIRGPGMLRRALVKQLNTNRNKSLGNDDVLVSVIKGLVSA